jgi:hypothetical protein
MNEFYQPASGLTFTEANLQSQTGLSPDSPASTLALNGVYTIVPSDDPYDPALYTSEPSYTIVGDYAEQGWTATPLPLATAKENGVVEVKSQTNSELAAVLTANGLSNDVVSAVSSQEAVDRPTRFQDVLDVMTALTNALDANITAIDAATTVDEINNIVNVPTGILFTGRGAGIGPEDLNVSYYNEFNSVSLTESDTELYVPGTATTIAYGSGGPGQFDSFGNCFNPGDYLMQIRETATSRVIAEFEVPLNPAGENVPF